MSGDTLKILCAMIGYMLIVIGIGLYFAKRAQANSENYFLGGRSLGPWVAAMSAEASDMSGWLLMGLPGVAYWCGLADAAWTAIGLAVGTYVNWLIVAKRLRRYSKVAGDAITVPDYLSNRFHEEKKVILGIAAADIAFCEEVLRTILGNDKIKVVRVNPQETITSLHREVTLDVLCEDEQGKLFNVEVQKGNREDDIKRCRFHAATVTATKTPKGTTFKDVPDVTVIYLSDYDALGYGKTLVKVKRFAIVDHKKEPFEDGEEIYYVNTVIKDGTRVSELMNLFIQRDAVQDDRFPATTKVFNYFKNTEKGRETMCDAVQSYAESYAEKYAEDREKKYGVKILYNLVRNGKLRKDEAVEQSGLTPDEFDAIAATLVAASN